MKRVRARRRTAAAIAVVFTGLAALAYGFYRPSIERARARTSAGSRVVSSRCGPIEFGELGAGPPVLLVHGAGGGFDQGLAMGEALAKAGFRVIAPSRFGYLRTPLPADASAARQADAHACLLDALGVSEAAVMGVSAGAPSALQFALRYAQRTSALVLLVPAVYAPHPAQAVGTRASRTTMFLLNATLRSDFVFWAGSKVARRTFIRSVLGTPPALLDGAPADEQARVQSFLDLILPVSDRRAGLLNDATIVSSLPRYDLEQIAAPTLAISVADDGYHTFDGAQYTAAHVRRGRFVGYPTGGHMLVGRNAAVSTEITSFLKAGAASP